MNNRTVLQKFVDDHFDPPGFELVEHYPEDWVSFPSSFLNIEDYHLRRWALHLHRIWRDLCRVVSACFYFHFFTLLFLLSYHKMILTRLIIKHFMSSLSSIIV